MRAGVARPATTYAERGRFFIEECKVCGLGRTSPATSWEDLERFYAEQYAYDAHALVANEKRWRARRIAGTLSLAGVSSALDVGCMYGYLLEGFRRAGVARVAGVELSSGPVEEARRRGLDVFQGTVEQYAASGPAAFDLVVAQHVLEHVPQPADFVRTAASLLAPGGRLAICVPNYGSRIRRLLGGAWGWYQVPVHIHHFTRAALSRLVESEGLKVERVVTRGGDSLCVLMGLRNMVQRGGGKPGAPGGMQKAAIRMASVLMRPYYYLGDDELLVIARRLGS